MSKNAKTATTVSCPARTSTWTMTGPEYAAPQPGQGPSWIAIQAKERGQYPFIDVAYLPTPCMHCDNAPCIKAAEDGAVFKRPDGIVLIDPVKAKGQKESHQRLPLRRHPLERSPRPAPEMHPLRPPARRRLDEDPLRPGLPHGGAEPASCRGRRGAKHHRRRAARGL